MDDDRLGDYRENKQVAFYDFEVFEQDWLVVIHTNLGLTFKIYNNVNQLKEVAEDIQCWIGYNNYNYDDLILAALLLGTDNVKEVSDAIIQGDKLFNLRKLARKFPTLDAMQELSSMKKSLKEIEANLGMNIHESPIDFNIRRKLTEQEVEEVFEYCYDDVMATKKIFDLRKDYFDSKMEIIQNFKLNVLDVKNTRANLTAKVLKAKKTSKYTNDQYDFKYDNTLDLEKIPEPIKLFFENVRTDFLDGADIEEIKNRYLDFNVNGVVHKYAFGGLHGCVNDLLYEGPILCVDVGSYYPSLMINNSFISRKSESPALFKNLYDTRMKYKKEKNNKQQIYKILLNATFGASGAKFNDLYDPQQPINICVNGQLLLTELIIDLKELTEVIQSNTDGIYFAYDPANLNEILQICKEWEQKHNLTLDYDYANKIIQRDVNNYAIRMDSGKIKTKGRFKNFKGGSFDNNNLSIIDKALVDYYIDNIKVQDTLLDQFKANNMIMFQQIAKMGPTYSKIKHKVNDEYVDVQKVNRIFATYDKKYGAIHKIKLKNGVESYEKIANSSPNVIIHNDDISKFDKSKLDLNYYKELIQNNIFKERRASNCQQLKEIQKQPIITIKEPKKNNQISLFQTSRV